MKRINFKWGLAILFCISATGLKAQDKNKKWAVNIGTSYNFYRMPKLAFWSAKRGTINTGTFIEGTYQPGKLRYSLSVGINKQQLHYKYYDYWPTFVKNRDVRNTFVSAEMGVYVPLLVHKKHQLLLFQGLQVNKFIKVSTQTMTYNGRLYDKRTYDADTFGIQLGPMIGIKYEYHFKHFNAGAQINGITTTKRPNRPTQYNIPPNMQYPSYFNLRTSLCFGYRF